jgi:hypothetical protein
MKTVHAIPQSIPLLVGRVSQHRRGQYKRPTLVITVWEPVARRHIEISLLDDFTDDAAI